MKKCMVCKSENTKSYKSKIGDFLSERISAADDARDCNLIYCKDCGFAFYDYRLSDTEAKSFYLGYRDDFYQKQRQKHDCWYTSELNEIIGKNEKETVVKKKLLSDVLTKYVDVDKIHSVLDFGGDKGQNFPCEFDNADKFVYELSEVEPVENVTLINRFEDLKKYDFIMCEGVLEHVSNLDSLLQDLKNIANKNSYFYIELPFDSPFFKSPFHNLQFVFSKYYSFSNILKHYIKMKKEKAFSPMSEHQNYFTKKSVEILLQSSGFDIITSQVQNIDKAWCKEACITVLAKLKEE